MANTDADEGEVCKTCGGEGSVMGVGDPTDGRPCPDCTDAAAREGGE